MPHLPLSPASLPPRVRHPSINIGLAMAGRYMGWCCPRKITIGQIILRQTQYAVSAPSAAMQDWEQKVQKVSTWYATPPTLVLAKYLSILNLDKNNPAWIGLHIYTSPFFFFFFFLTNSHGQAHQTRTQPDGACQMFMITENTKWFPISASLANKEGREVEGRRDALFLAACHLNKQECPFHPVKLCGGSTLM